MWLLDVEAVLEREKVPRRVGSKIEVLRELDVKTSYAILSHRWKTEVTYEEMTGLIRMNSRKRVDVRERDGYQKIIKSCEQAKKDGYEWLWIDTCCIDRRSSAELSEAINSMYQWYRNSQKCYVYFHDVEESVFPTNQDFRRFGGSNGWPEWFSRSWTLQELIAPKKVEFFNKRWESIGTKQERISTLEDITQIPWDVLMWGPSHLGRRNVAQVMSWAADRKTMRVEDRAYSLLGLFGVNMPILYGEGSKAFQRLQKEIIRVSGDHSIFAWNPRGRFRRHASVLADDPSCFRGCHDIKCLDHSTFIKELEAFMRRSGLDVDVDRDKIEPLWHGVESPQLFRFNVTNLGIQVWLPAVPKSRNSGKQGFKAILPCRDRYGNLITIDLTSHGLTFGRSWGLDTPNTWPELRSLCLDCSQDTEEDYHQLRLHDRRTSWRGFTRRVALPDEIAGDTVTFSQGNTLVVLVYTNNDARIRFAVGLAHYLGKLWARVICSTNPEVQSSWADFAKQAYGILWNAPIDNSFFDTDSIQKVHIPQSIWDASIIRGNSDTNVMIDIEQCPGCCTGRLEYIYTPVDCKLWLPRANGYSSDGFELILNGQFALLDKYSGQQIAAIMATYM
ncbi:heterokaryon incompatibility protein-domain-containing protein [Pisolithus orientalis]|uniref:heterokaryon incompatibility protein-domain-containing protein n=1 Tax=Pisolithus orientalis TaxID=936130 RepID=UPI0022256714|nr:heterokaryon incompatibility protein-domain-containing protein [Pisolithus orientalis]KAI6002255.1 heterokaryon incompatibility protein-domain-containing protein [Pisolithus orientalis]